MAAQDDALRLSVQLVNQTSGPLRDIQRSMRALAGDTKITQQQGAKFAARNVLHRMSWRTVATPRRTATCALSKLCCGVCASTGVRACWLSTVAGHGCWSSVSVAALRFWRRRSSVTHRRSGWHDLAFRCGQRPDLRCAGVGQSDCRIYG
jgi:hypothetical protein